jgi:hypothetical protein
MCSGVFCDETHQNAIPEVPSQKDASQNGVLESYFPGTGITNTIPLQPNFASHFAFQNVFLNEACNVISNHLVTAINSGM